MKTVFLSILTIIICISVQAQSADTLKLRQTDSLQTLPPLQDLIDSAMKYNAMMHLTNRGIVLKEINLESQRNFWTRNMGFQADTRYGTFDNFATNDNGQSTTLMNTTMKQLNYGVGVYMKFPLLDLLNRKTQIKQAKTELDQAKDMADVQAGEIRQLVIRQYQELLLKQRLLALKSQHFSNARLNMEMAEKEFRNGVSVIADFNRVSELYNKAEIDFETASTEYITSKMILMEITGFRF